MAGKKPFRLKDYIYCSERIEACSPEELKKVKGLTQSTKHYEPPKRLSIVIDGFCIEYFEDECEMTTAAKIDANKRAESCLQKLPKEDKLSKKANESQESIEQAGPLIDGSTSQNFIESSSPNRSAESLPLDNPCSLAAISPEPEVPNVSPEPEVPNESTDSDEVSEQEPEVPNESTDSNEVSEQNRPHSSFRKSSETHPQPDSKRPCIDPVRVSKDKPISDAVRKVGWTISDSRNNSLERDRSDNRKRYRSPDRTPHRTSRNDSPEYHSRDRPKKSLSPYRSSHKRDSYDRFIPSSKHAKFNQRDATNHYRPSKMRGPHDDYRSSLYHANSHQSRTPSHHRSSEMRDRNNDVRSSNIHQKPARSYYGPPNISTSHGDVSSSNYPKNPQRGAPSRYGPSDIPNSYGDVRSSSYSNSHQVGAPGLYGSSNISTSYGDVRSSSYSNSHHTGAQGTYGHSNIPTSYGDVGSSSYSNSHQAGAPAPYGHSDILYSYHDPKFLSNQPNIYQNTASNFDQFFHQGPGPSSYPSNGYRPQSFNLQNFIEKRLMPLECVRIVGGRCPNPPQDRYRRSFYRNLSFGFPFLH